LVTQTVPAVISWCLLPYARLGLKPRPGACDWSHGPYEASSFGVLTAKERGEKGNQPCHARGDAAGRAHLGVAARDLTHLKARFETRKSHFSLQGSNHHTRRCFQALWANCMRMQGSAVHVTGPGTRLGDDEQDGVCGAERGERDGARAAHQQRLRERHQGLHRQVGGRPRTSHGVVVSGLSTFVCHTSNVRVYVSRLRTDRCETKQTKKSRVGADALAKMSNVINDAAAIAVSFLTRQDSISGTPTRSMRATS
jgi:hypothetical protein